MLEVKGTTEDEMVGWHHRLDGHEFEQTPGVADGQGSLAYGCPWGCKESNTTEQLSLTQAFVDRRGLALMGRALLSKALILLLMGGVALPPW